MAQKTFRFAPSPTGYLHLGHAYAALTCQKICRAHNGTMLLRMEDIDQTRCSIEYETAIVEDLQWLGFEWQGEIRRQSEHFDIYHDALSILLDRSIAYPATLSRKQIRKIVDQLEKNGTKWPSDPEGAPVYPGKERKLNPSQQDALRAASPDYCVRIDIHHAMQHIVPASDEKLFWLEFQKDDSQVKKIPCDPLQWGDVILGGRDNMTSYHLASVIDDGLQAITHVVRGKDIYNATAIHRLLQEILGITPPLYHHHDLVLDDEGRKLSKRDKSTTIRQLRLAGMGRDELLALIGLDNQVTCS